MAQGSFVRSGSSDTFFPGSSVHREKKEWGEEQWIVNKEYCGKKLILKKNRRCSLHMHREKDEVFYLISGLVKLELGKRAHTMHPGDFAHVPPHLYHRFTGLEDSEIIEFSTHHQEEDSFRKEFSGHSDPVRFARQSALLRAFAQQRVLVVGDVMVDRYILGHVERVSPEAPIPVLSVRAEHEVLGGAGNCAVGLAALGASPYLVSVCGADATGKRLRALAKKSMRSTLIVDASRATTLKERIVGNGQQIVRIDHETSEPLSAATERKVIAAIGTAAPNATVILVSDYAKGVLTPRVFAAIYAAGRRRRIPVVVDPKPLGVSSLRALKGASLIAPNVREAHQLLGEHHLSDHLLGRRLSAKLSGAVFLTRGAKGVDVYHHGALLVHFDALAHEVVDVSGAGDTIALTAALVLGAGGSPEDAADIGNRAASIVVQKHGTATVTPPELEAVL